MTIELYTFKPQLLVEDLTDLNMGTLALFGNPREIPADRKEDITGTSSQPIVLHTRGVPDEEYQGHDQTIGEIETVDSKNGSKYIVDSKKPIAILGKNAEVNGKKGYAVETVVLFRRSQ